MSFPAFYPPRDHPPLVLTPPPPPPTPSSSDSGFPILAITIPGILTIALLLLGVYVFVIKCCLNWQRSDAVRRLSRSQRHRLRRDDLTVAYSTYIEGRGLEESAIQAIPTFRFMRGSSDDEDGKSSFHECAVCLNEFQEEERVRILPRCLHVFHIDCIDVWLQTHANCPLCRSAITSLSPFQTDRIAAQTPRPNNLDQGDSVVIEVRDDEGDRTSRVEAATDTSTNPTGRKKERKLQKVSSMGDECIVVRGGDEQFAVQRMRRSFSMDSSSDRQLYMAVQEILQQNPHFQEVGNGEGSSSGGGGSARLRRSFFSFGLCRSSQNSSAPPIPDPK